MNPLTDHAKEALQLAAILLLLLGGALSFLGALLITVSVLSTSVNINRAATPMTNNISHTYNLQQAAAVGPGAISYFNKNLLSGINSNILVEVAQEIQSLICQLRKEHPNVNESEMIAFVNHKIEPDLKKRAANALISGGDAAIEEILDNPYVNITKAIIRGWTQSG